MAGLSEKVARKMRLSGKEIDDIRVAALLMDMENIEITARVIKKAVGELESSDTESRTFHGAELVHSLGGVLTGAFPLILSQVAPMDRSMVEQVIPFGARIICSVRAFLKLADDPWSGSHLPAAEVLSQMRCDIDHEHHPAVLHALAEVVGVTEVATTASRKVEKLEANH